MHSTVGLRGLSSGCLSGTLGDVLMFADGTCPTASGIPAMSDAMDTRSNTQCNNMRNPIEWQLLKDVANMNANQSKFTGADCRLPVLNQNHYNIASAGPWHSPRLEERVVNYFQAFGPVHTDSNRCSVDGHVGEIKLTLDGQLLNSVVSSEVSHTVKSADSEEEHFRASSPTVRSRVLGANSSAQRLYARRLGISSSPSMQNLNQSSIQGIRNLFPEQSSNFSSVLSYEGMGHKVSEQLHVPKKARISDYTGGPLPHAEATANHLNHGSHNEKAFPHAQLASLLALPPYKTPSSSFISSLPDRSRFNSNVPSLQNTTLSSFTNSGPAAPMNNSNEGASLQITHVDYSFSNETPSVQGGFSSCAAQGGLLVSGRNSFGASNFVQPPTLECKQVSLSRNFMPPGSLGQGCSGLHATVDTGAAWPVGFINSPSGYVNSPSLGFQSASGASKTASSQRSLFEAEQPNGLSGDAEAGKGHQMLESRIRLLIQKQLTTTDVGSLGRVILPKKEAETHLPHLPDKEGIEICFYDYDVQRTWVMKYRFWPNNKSRMYLLENTGEFLKFHDLHQGDLLLIYRELPARYVLRAKKMLRSLIPLPPSQTVVETGVLPAEDVDRAVSVPGRVISTQSAGQETSGTSASGYHQLSSDILAFSSAFSPTDRPRNLSSHDILDGKPPVLSRISNRHRHQVAKVTEDDQQPRLKSCVSQLQHEMSADLDGEGVYNLEEFPSLIEAEELIDNIFPSDGSNCGPTGENLG